MYHVPASAASRYIIAAKKCNVLILYCSLLDHSNNRKLVQLHLNAMPRLTGPELTKVRFAKHAAKKAHRQLCAKKGFLSVYNKQKHKKQMAQVRSFKPHKQPKPILIPSTESMFETTVSSNSQTPTIREIKRHLNKMINNYDTLSNPQKLCLQSLHVYIYFLMCYHVFVPTE